MTRGTQVIRLTAGSLPQSAPDRLSVEEPLELRVGGRSIAVTMRTPGADFDLAAGFLVTEGIIACHEELRSLRYCLGAEGAELQQYNVVDATLAPGIVAPSSSVRTLLTSSSCGLCGKASIDAVRTRSAFDIASDPLSIAPSFLVGLPDRLRAAQELFDQTGGLHAAALFDGRSGEMLVLREDVGRHNAVDKVLGWALRQGRIPLRGSVLVVSGRASFELVQKAMMAGVPMLAAVSAPSSLAVELAAETAMTLVGFLRGTSMVIYAGAHRVEGATTSRGVSGAGHAMAVGERRRERRSDVPQAIR